MHRDAIPEKARIPVNQVRRRGIAELPVHSGLFELEVECIGFTGVHRIPELTDQIGSLDQFRLQANGLHGLINPRWKTGQFNCVSDARCVDQW